VKIFLSSRERVAGLFLLTAVAGVVAFVVGTAINNRWFVERVPYHVHIARGDGLPEKSPVLLSGIQMGEVGSLTILEDNRVDVEILIYAHHVARMREGTRAEIRRLLGIGEKRIHLHTDSPQSPPLAPGSRLPVVEPRDLLDFISNVDLDRYASAVDRAVAALELLLSSVEQDDRLARMLETVDKLGPLIESVDSLLRKAGPALTSLAKDPALKRTLRGADRLLNDPNLPKTLRGAASALAPERVDALLVQTDRLIGRLEVLLQADGGLHGTLAGTNRLLNDGRLDRVLASVEKASDAVELQTLVGNTALLAEQMAQIGPEIPALTRDLLATLREAVIVLKALQRTWILKDESAEVREEAGERRE